MEGREVEVRWRWVEVRWRRVEVGGASSRGGAFSRVSPGTLSAPMSLLSTYIRSTCPPSVVPRPLLLGADVPLNGSYLLDLGPLGDGVSGLVCLLSLSFVYCCRHLDVHKCLQLFPHRALKSVHCFSSFGLRLLLHLLSGATQQVLSRKHDHDATWCI